MNADTVKLKPAIFKRVQELSYLTSFSPEEIVNRILSAHFDEASKVSYPYAGSHKENHECKPITKIEEAFDRNIECAPLIAENRRLIPTHRNVTRMSFWKVTRFDNLELESCLWNEAPVFPVTVQAVLDIALLDFCARTSDRPDMDIEMIENISTSKQNGIGAVRAAT